jgi:hypothetical protein
MGSDGGLPYEKAIEETAKATGKAIDFVRNDIAPAISNVYGLLIGDRLAAAREKNLDEISRRTKKILKDRDVKERIAAPEQIAIPLLESAQGETRSDLQDLWARLLANAMDPKRSENVRPEFIETLRQLQPIDARILDEGVIAKSKKENIVVAKLHEAMNLRYTAVSVSLANLEKLGCIRRISGGNYAVLTEYGAELMIAVEI